jgi:DNA-binding transcriptional regulator GbsR (MarR family)
MKMIATLTKSASSLSQARLEMIEAGGRLCQLLGLPRSVGQIYGLLFLSPKALALDEIAELLSISKASVSTGTRQLVGWRAIRQVWVPGERRDHFEVEADLGHLLRSSYTDFIKPRLSSSSKRVEKMSAGLEEDLAQGVLTQEEYELCSERLQGFLSLQKKLEDLAPLAEKLL